MLDMHNKPISVGSRVVTVKNDGCVPVGSVGTVIRIAKKPKGWSRSRKFPVHAMVNDTGKPLESDDWTWSGWYDSDEIAKVNASEVHP